MDFLNNIMENSTMPWLTAWVLGLMTAISPCPLATNISAIGFIGRDLSDRRRVFFHGLVYTLGRAVSYTALALVLFFGASQINISLLFQGWGPKILRPLLIIIGLCMLDVIRVRFPGFSGLTDKMENHKGRYLNTLLLGMVFALAFCPYSGVLYFAILIPMTISSAAGLYLPVLFAMATGLPMILFAWLMAYSVGSVSAFHQHLRTFELWFRRVVAVLFMVGGMYYLLRLFL